MAQSWDLQRLSRLRQSPLGRPLLPSFIPRPAIVSKHSIKYQSHHLLSLPYEVRERVWRLIFQTIAQSPIYELSLKPYTSYDGLSLTCRQINLETSNLWPLLFVTSNRVGKFLSQPVSKFNFIMMQRLSLELPFNLDRNLMTKLAQVLADASTGSRLQDLQIFFIGADAYGTTTYVHGCGMVMATSDSFKRKLPIDGQIAEDRVRLLLALKNLGALRSLVLENCQLPLFEQAILANKPKLERLHISTDPRTTLHRQLIVANPRLHFPLVRIFPPVKELDISANAINAAAAVITGMAPTLQKLSWIIPDPSRQVGSCGRTWFSDTYMLLQNLQMRAPNLHTLRICTEGTIYEGGDQYGHLIGAFHVFLPSQRSLKSFEFHATSRSQWFGGEVIEALPNTLSRAYLSDNLMPVSDLVRKIKERYLSVGSGEESENAAFDARVIIDNKHHRLVQDSYTKGNLSFVTFEYSDPEQDRHLLKLNGRLLDRERNSHLASHAGTRCLNLGLMAYGRPMDDHRFFYVGNKAKTDIQNRQDGVRINAYGHTAEPAWIVAMQDIKASSNSDTAFSLTPHPYFGDETEAEHLFLDEMAAPAEEVLARKLSYPGIVEIDGVNHGYYHWMSDGDCAPGKLDIQQSRRYEMVSTSSYSHSSRLLHVPLAHTSFTSPVYSTPRGDATTFPLFKHSL